MNYYDLYDKILRELSKDGGLSDPGQNHDVDLRYLDSCGYVYLQEAEGGKIFAFGITKEGLRFISEGGFTQKSKDKRKAEIKYWTPISISVLVFMLSILSYIKNATQIEKSNAAIEIINGKMDILKGRIDSLSNIQQVPIDNVKQTTNILSKSNKTPTILQK